MSVRNLRAPRQKVRLAWDDKIFYIVINTIVLLITLSVVFPIMHVLAASFSSGVDVMAGRVLFWPVNFSIHGYQLVFSNNAILLGYWNTIIYTVSGTFINLVLTSFAAYALSRNNVPFMGVIMFFFVLSMMVSGGMVATFITFRNYGILDTRWVMILPGAISITNLIIMRTFFRNIPAELLEAAKIDGCSDFRYFFTILIPLSKAVIAVMVLFYAEGHWNQFFRAMMFLFSRNLAPLQIILREILIMGTMIEPDPDAALEIQQVFELLRYCLIVVASVPIIMIYPFVQKHFIKGVMIGSIKG